MHHIGLALSNLNAVSENSKNLSNMINHTAELAENVSAKVRRLDEARVRMKIMIFYVKSYLNYKNHIYINFRAVSANANSECTI